MSARALERAARGVVPEHRAPPRGSQEPRRLPTTALQHELFTVWHRLLKLDGMSIDDDFFDLGGTSIVVVELLAELERRYGWRRPLGALFPHTTIAMLADEIERGRAPAPEVTREVPRLADLVARHRVRQTLYVEAPASRLVNAPIESRYAAPRTRTEWMLAAIWTQVLGVDQVGVEDNFFRLGGHSLLVMRVVAGIRRELGIELAPRMVFEYPTLAAQAELLAESASATRQDAAVVRELAELVDSWSDAEVATRLADWSTVALELAPSASTAIPRATSSSRGSSRSTTSTRRHRGHSQAIAQHRPARPRSRNDACGT